MQSFRELLVWQHGMELVTELYRITETFPKSELYGLVSQIRRAAVSIPANIAEGHQRESTKEYLRFLSISRGSLAELETELELSLRLGYLNPVTHDNLREAFDRISRMLRNLQKALKRKLE